MNVPPFRLSGFAPDANMATDFLTNHIQGANPHPAGANPSAASNVPTFPLQSGTYVTSGWTQDQGVDIATNGGGCGGAAPLLAMGAGTIVNRGISGFGGDAPVLKLDSPISGQTYIYYGHAGNSSNSPGCNNPGVGTHVTAGQVIGCVGCGSIGISSGPHLEIGFAAGPNGPYGGGTSGTMLSVLHSAQVGKAVPGGGTGGGTSGGGSGGGGSTGGGISAADAIHISKSVVFSTLLNFPTEDQMSEAEQLGGRKSLMLDQSLMPFIEQLCMCTQRNFMSLPNGDFVAFFPDYFGGLADRQPYWDIQDIEIMHDDLGQPSGTIYIGDDSLATHVYTVGDIVGLGSTGQALFTDKLVSAGVVDIGMAFSADFINGSPISPSQAKATITTRHGRKVVAADTFSDLGLIPAAKLTQTLAFLQRYGARPYFEFASFIRSPYYETFYAFQKFMLMWAQQFTTNFTFTFMPELYPGGIVKFPNHGLQMYVKEVTHTCDYVNGFRTEATLIAPAATADAADRGINQGMLRQGVLTTQPPPSKS